jgi:hypothetical protein
LNPIPGLQNLEKYNGKNCPLSLREIWLECKANAAD